MKNTLIRDNFEEISKLSKPDQEIVMDYFENWTPEYPATYSDGETQQDKLEGMFQEYLKEKGYEYDDELSSRFQEVCSYTEYSIPNILSLYYGKMEDWEQDFEEWFEEYLEEIETNSLPL